LGRKDFWAHYFSNTQTAVCVFQAKGLKNNEELRMKNDECQNKAKITNHSTTKVNFRLTANSRQLILLSGNFATV